MIVYFQPIQTSITNHLITYIIEQQAVGLMQNSTVQQDMNKLYNNQILLTNPVEPSYKR